MPCSRIDVAVHVAVLVDDSIIVRKRLGVYESTDCSPELVQKVLVYLPAVFLAMDRPCVNAHSARRPTQHFYSRIVYTYGVVKWSGAAAIVVLLAVRPSVHAVVRSRVEKASGTHAVLVASLQQQMGK